MKPYYQDDQVTLYCGDCLEIMPGLEPNSIDSVITDPPYGLSFMGKAWDHGVPGIPFWEAALGVAKPGSILLAFGGTRTHHRLACSVEDAGWLIRDTVYWAYGQGFPKSMDISKAIDKAAGVEREVVGTRRTGVQHGSFNNGSVPEQDKWQPITAPATDAAQLWDGWGTALKPAVEPITVAMKTLDGTFAENALKWGVAGLWIDGGRVGAEIRTYAMSGAPGGNGQRLNGGDGRDVENARQYAAKSKRKPPTTVAGRWPANLIHDGSEEVLALFPMTTSGSILAHHKRTTTKTKNAFGQREALPEVTLGDSGSAARFFYVAKPAKSERGETNNHPTVKPIALIRYLCRLTSTPTGGIVLDPFAGSGTTLLAARNENRRAVGIELSEEYCRIIVDRLKPTTTFISLPTTTNSTTPKTEVIQQNLL